jgi:putative methionine-R-sulfoxide reductase with GAF domain
VLGAVYQSQKPVNIGNLPHDAQFKNVAIRRFASLSLSELCLPITIRNRVCWMLNVEDSRENAFSPEEVAELEVIMMSSKICSMAPCHVILWRPPLTPLPTL